MIRVEECLRVETEVARPNGKVRSQFIKSRKQAGAERQKPRVRARISTGIGPGTRSRDQEQKTRGGSMDRKQEQVGP